MHLRIGLDRSSDLVYRKSFTISSNNAQHQVNGLQAGISSPPAPPYVFLLPDIYTRWLNVGLNSRALTSPPLTFCPMFSCPSPQRSGENHGQVISPRINSFRACSPRDGEPSKRIICIVLLYFGVRTPAHCTYLVPVQCNVERS